MPERTFRTALAKAAYLAETLDAKGYTSRASIIHRGINNGVGGTLHPQQRTQAFHQFYDAPIHTGPVNMTFSHMGDERVAMRMAFILSEAFEILTKGLGLKYAVEFSGDDEDSVQQTGLNPNHNTLMCCIFRCLQSVPEQARNLIEVADGLGDLNVVVNGFALELGLQMNRIDQEIAASNFTKGDEEGNPIIGNGHDGPVGKVLKGPDYMEPQLQHCIRWDTRKD